ncbi:hypothetical protein KKE26_10415 [bacterium]|nr:hypothetical protein [bacterium]MBU1754381.1 hypothetical protein [bacterium]
MKVLQLELPDTLAKDLMPMDSRYICQLIDLGMKQLKMENALVLLKKGGVSIGYAAKIADVTMDEMSTFAYAKGLIPTFSIETLKEELAA